MKIPCGQFVYTKEDGDILLKYLRKNGVNAEVIGTLPSNHDIDLLIDKNSIPSKTPNHWLFEVTLQARKRIKTDLGSIFVLSARFGHVDVFFEDPNIKYNEACMIIKKALQGKRRNFSSLLQATRIDREDLSYCIGRLLKEGILDGDCLPSSRVTTYYLKSNSGNTKT